MQYSCQLYVQSEGMQKYDVVYLYGHTHTDTHSHSHIVGRSLCRIHSYHFMEMGYHSIGVCVCARERSGRAQTFLSEALAGPLARSIRLRSHAYSRLADFLLLCSFEGQPESRCRMSTLARSTLC